VEFFMFSDSRTPFCHMFDYILFLPNGLFMHWFTLIPVFYLQKLYK